MRLQDTDAFILKCFAADIQDLTIGDIEDTIKLCTIADRYIERLGNSSCFIALQWFSLLF